MKNRIRNLFTEHGDGDGDFIVAMSDSPLSVICPKKTAEAVVYSTKPHCTRGLSHELGDRMPFTAVLCCGLPSDEDLSQLRTIVESRRLIFLGDADPADLLTFALLRETMPTEYAGMSDQLLRKCGVPLQDELSSPLAASELAALPFVRECVGDLPRRLGPWCSGLLDSGRKVELEALFSFATVSPSAVAAALVADGP
ncbi:MAG: hypothetical protein KDA60_11300 [Planctomycetales bacterium]|nr:hypothetical protein [Planctomycetales bacterium]